MGNICFTTHTNELIAHSSTMDVFKRKGLKLILNNKTFQLFFEAQPTPDLNPNIAIKEMKKQDVKNWFLSLGMIVYAERFLSRDCDGEYLDGISTGMWNQLNSIKPLPKGFQVELQTLKK